MICKLYIYKYIYQKDKMKDSKKDKRMSLDPGNNMHKHLFKKKYGAT